MSFDFTTIFVTNLLCVVLLCVLFIGNLSRLKNTTPEGGYLIGFGTVVFLASIVDTVAYWLVGHTGATVRILMLICNTYAYFALLAICHMWIMFLALHVHAHATKRWTAIVNMPLVVEGIILFVLNPFTHVVFWVDSNNVFHRGPIYFMYFCTLLFYAILGLVIYVLEERRHRHLRFFPVWAFIAPTLIGCTIQIFNYGTPLTWASLSIALAGILSSRQNEFIYRDKLTGLLNRTYLDFALREGIRHPDRNPLGIMIDVNSFKSINDEFGHLAGDRALNQVAGVLRKVVSNRDAIIRYAGDEFIVLVDPRAKEDAAKYMERIAQEFDAFNAAGTEPYRLTVSMGCSAFDSTSMTADEFLKSIDQQMYEDKRLFYAQQENDRRVND